MKCPKCSGPCAIIMDRGKGITPSVFHFYPLLTYPFRKKKILCKKCGKSFSKRAILTPLIIALLLGLIALVLFP